MKNLRLILVAALVVCFVAIAGSQAWAAAQPAAAPAQAAAADTVTALKGTVNPSGCGGFTNIDATTRSLCGSATVRGLVAGDTVIGYAYLDPVPDGFMSKVVNIVFTSPGSATICFASASGGVIYNYISALDIWSPVLTEVSGGQACTTTSSTGAYVLGN